MAESARGAPLVRQLCAWRWLLLWAATAAVAALTLPTRVALAPPLELAASAEGWTVSPALALGAGSGVLELRSSGSGPALASRALAVPGEATFVEVRACFGAPLRAGQGAVLLASVTGGYLDFNRPYLVDTLAGVRAGECLVESLPRRRGDGPAILQLQLLGAGGAMALKRLAITAQAENPPWRWIRWAMLASGLALVALRFGSYVRHRPTWLAVSGLLVVAGILFGCCVSTGLKADIFALFTGGRQLPVPAEMAALLTTPFPLGGFAIFTGLHALLFATATATLGLLFRRAYVDLLLLAVTTELLQVFVPGRGPGMGDVLVDWSGVLSGMLAVVALRRSERVRLLLEEQGVDEDVPRF